LSVKTKGRENANGKGSKRFYLEPSPDKWPANAVIICSGALAEQNSFLRRLAEGELELPYRRGDALIVSQRVIPKTNIQERFVEMMKKLTCRFDRIYLADSLLQLPHVPTYEARIIRYLPDLDAAGRQVLWEDGTPKYRQLFLHTSGHATTGEKKLVFDHLTYRHTTDGAEQRISPKKTVIVHGGEDIRKICAGLVQEWGGEAIMLNDGEVYRIPLSNP